MKKNRYYLIDLFKLLGAIAIVATHTIATGGRTGPFYTFLSKIIYGLPVPFFFVCSGFLLGNKLLKKDNDLKETTISYIKRLILPLCFWCFVSQFFLYDFIGGYNNINFWITLVQNFLFSPWSAMWYVMGLIIAIIIIYPFIKKKKYKELLILSFIMYLVSLLFGNYYFLIKNEVITNIFTYYKKIFLTTRNGLFYGLPFTTFGIMLANIKSKKDINYNKVLLIVIISFIILLLEVFILEKKEVFETSSLYLSNIILVPSFVLYLSKFKASKPDLSKLGKYSVGIYFTHQCINYIYKSFTSLVGIKLFVAVIITSLVLITVLYKINNKYINKVIS